jgi:Ser/Thr protein kinase RdoA (MazF antagonist)
MPSTLSTPLQQSIRQNYSLRVKTATPIGTGAMSTTMQLETDQGRLFLKCYKPTIAQATDQQRIAFTHAVHHFLWQQDFPVPRLFANKMGQTYTTSNGQIYAISEFIEGNDYGAHNAAAGLQHAGEMLGRLHQCLSNFRVRETHVGKLDWEPMEREILRQLKTRLVEVQSVVGARGDAPVSREQLSQWLAELDVLAEQLPTHPNPRWIIHGDYRAQNLKFDDENRIRAILDFDTARPADRLYDLAYALVFFPAVYQDTPLTSAQQSFFLQAYQSICPLSEAEQVRLSTHLRLAFLRGMGLWLELHHFAGMQERTQPWIEGYLRHSGELLMG